MQKMKNRIRVRLCWPKAQCDKYEQYQQLNMPCWFVIDRASGIHLSACAPTPREAWADAWARIRRRLDSHEVTVMNIARLSGTTKQQNKKG